MGLLRRAAGAIGKAVRRRDFFSPREYAKVVKVPVKFIKSQISKGAIPTQRVNGKKLIKKSTGRIVRTKVERAFARKLGVTVRELRRETQRPTGFAAFAKKAKKAQKGLKRAGKQIRKRQRRSGGTAGKPTLGILGL